MRIAYKYHFEKVQNIMHETLFPHYNIDMIVNFYIFAVVSLFWSTYVDLLPLTCN